MRKAPITAEGSKDFVSLFKDMLAKFGGSFTAVKADKPVDRTGRYQWPESAPKHRLRFVTNDSSREIRDRSLGGRQRTRARKAARRLRKMAIEGGLTK